MSTNRNVVDRAPGKLLLLSPVLHFGDPQHLLCGGTITNTLSSNQQQSCQQGWQSQRNDWTLTASRHQLGLAQGTFSSDRKGVCSNDALSLWLLAA